MNWVGFSDISTLFIQLYIIWSHAEFSMENGVCGEAQLIHDISLENFGFGISFDVHDVQYLLRHQILGRR